MIVLETDSEVSMHHYVKRDAETAHFIRPEGMSRALYELLCARGISSAEEAREFLRPNEDMLLDPFTLDGVKEAAERIESAVKAGTGIYVYGDYDVDGVSASAIMYMTLKELGGDVNVYLPSRHTEGYGLNRTAIDEIAHKCGLLISVDCGITSVELVEHARSLGLEVIITDHHTPGDAIPDCIVVNPLIGGYKNRNLCGGGVAYKLSEALLGRRDAMKYIDIAGLATIADVVSLTGENRVITSLALREINKCARLGIRKLRETASLAEKPLTATNIAFQIAPRLNASGRLGSAFRAFELLTTDNEKKAASIALDLDAENKLRKTIEDVILQNASEQLKDFDFINHRAIVIAGDGWNSGVVGLAASKLVEKYNYPSIVISFDGEKGTGSCRSIEGINIYEALKSAEGLLVKFGGHKQAAGLTIERKNLGAFTDALDAYLKAEIPPEVYIPVTYYDAEVSLKDLDLSTVKLFESFEPTGMGNPKPKLRVKANVTDPRRMGADGRHLMMRLDDGTDSLRGVAFGFGDMADTIPDSVDAIFEPVINEFRGSVKVEAQLKEIKPLGANALLEESRPREDALLTRFLTEVLYNKTVTLSDNGPVSTEALDEALSASPQGTLVIASDFETAEMLADRPVDIFVGEFPGDERCFNTLSVLPTGEIPKGYTRVVYAGMKAFGGGRQLDGCYARWRNDLPDIDCLRAVYRAVRRIAVRPAAATDAVTLVESIKEEASVTTATAAASIAILLDCGLLTYAEDERIRLGEAKKIDMADNRAFILCGKLK